LVELSLLKQGKINQLVKLSLLPPQYNSFEILGKNVAGKNLEKIIKKYR
jgi:hypothetical protein